MFLVGVGYTLHAQSTNLKDYVGKYVFEAGSPVAEVTITVEDSSLVINSAMGSTPISKKGVDTFYLAQYDALIRFYYHINPDELSDEEWTKYSNEIFARSILLYPNNMSL